MINAIRACWAVLFCYAIALAACRPTGVPSAYAGVYVTTSDLTRDQPCDAMRSADAAYIVSVTLDELRKTGKVLDGDPVHVCVVAKHRVINCGGVSVYACALPFKGGPRIWVAGAHPQWRATLAHEVLAVMAYIGRSVGWPRHEFCVGSIKKCSTKDPRYQPILRAVAKRLAVR